MSGVPWLHIVGIGAAGELPPGHRAVVEAAEVLLGGERQLALFPGLGEERIDIVGRMAELPALLRARAHRRCVVLASGDPLFYGIGTTVLRHFPDARVLTAPSSVALAFARIGLPCHDARVVSIHGRPMGDLGRALDESGKLAILTGGENTPAAVGRALGPREGTAWICARLGYEDEQVVRLPLAELAEAEAPEPNVLILLAPLRRAPRFPQLADEDFDKKMPRRGLITKREVRTLSLAALRLREGDIAWDIGAGSGAVSVEMALLGASRVFAVEKNEDACAIIRGNAAAFALPQVEVVHALAPEGLEALPDPDAVFVGGTAGRMRPLLELLLRRCRGCVVVNLATIENLAECVDVLKGAGRRWSVTQVQIARGQPILDLHRFEAHNPVWIVEAQP